MSVSSRGSSSPVLSRQETPPAVYTSSTLPEAGVQVDPDAPSRYASLQPSAVPRSGLPAAEPLFMRIKTITTLTPRSGRSMAAVLDTDSEVKLVTAVVKDAASRSAACVGHVPNADITRLREEVGKGDAEIVHISGHGYSTTTVRTPAGVAPVSTSFYVARSGAVPMPAVRAAPQQEEVVTREEGQEETAAASSSSDGSGAVVPVDSLMEPAAADCSTGPGSGGMSAALGAHQPATGLTPLFPNLEASFASNMSAYVETSFLNEVRINAERNRRRPLIFVLMGCETGTIGKEIARAVPHAHVICWHSRVRDIACHCFSAAFYRALLQRLMRVRKEGGGLRNRDVLHAFYVAKEAMEMYGLVCTDPDRWEADSSGVGRRDSRPPLPQPPPPPLDPAAASPGGGGDEPSAAYFSTAVRNAAALAAVGVKPEETGVLGLKRWSDTVLRATAASRGAEAPPSQQQEQQLHDVACAPGGIPLYLVGRAVDFNAWLPGFEPLHADDREELDAADVREAEADGLTASLPVWLTVHNPHAPPPVPFPYATRVPAPPSVLVTESWAHLPPALFDQEWFLSLVRAGGVPDLTLQGSGGDSEAEATSSVQVPGSALRLPRTVQLAHRGAGPLTLLPPVQAVFAHSDVAHNFAAMPTGLSGASRVRQWRNDGFDTLETLLMPYPHFLGNGYLRVYMGLWCMAPLADRVVLAREVAAASPPALALQTAPLESGHGWARVIQGLNEAAPGYVAVASAEAARVAAVSVGSAVPSPRTAATVSLPPAASAVPGSLDAWRRLPRMLVTADALLNPATAEQLPPEILPPALRGEVVWVGPSEVDAALQEGPSLGAVLVGAQQLDLALALHVLFLEELGLRAGAAPTRRCTCASCTAAPARMPACVIRRVAVAVSAATQERQGSTAAVSTLDAISVPLLPPETSPPPSHALSLPRSDSVDSFSFPSAISDSAFAAPPPPVRRQHSSSVVSDDPASQASVLTDPSRTGGDPGALTPRDPAGSVLTLTGWQAAATTTQPAAASPSNRPPAPALRTITRVAALIAAVEAADAGFEAGMRALEQARVAGDAFCNAVMEAVWEVAEERQSLAQAVEALTSGTAAAAVKQATDALLRLQVGGGALAARDDPSDSASQVRSIYTDNDDESNVEEGLEGGAEAAEARAQAMASRTAAAAAAAANGHGPPPPALSAAAAARATWTELVMGPNYREKLDSTFEALESTPRLLIGPPGRLARQDGGPPPDVVLKPLSNLVKALQEALADAEAVIEVLWRRAVRLHARRRRTLRELAAEAVGASFGGGETHYRDAVASAAAARRLGHGPVAQARLASAAASASGGAAASGGSGDSSSGGAALPVDAEAECDPCVEGGSDEVLTKPVVKEGLRVAYLAPGEDLATFVNEYEALRGLEADQKACGACTLPNHVAMPLCEYCGTPFDMV